MASAPDLRPPTLAQRTTWLGGHRDWIACRLPHFTRRGDAFYFMVSRRPALHAGPPVIEMFERIDGTRPIAELLGDGGDMETLAVLWDVGIIQVVPPDTGPQPRIVVIEPHPDDAALSAGGALLHWRDRATIDVVSVCSRSNSTSYMATASPYCDADAITDLRHDESELAARLLRARYTSLRQPDIPLRYLAADDYTPARMRATRFRAGGYRRMPPPEAAVDETTQLLWKHLRSARLDELWFPLGAGNHFDHRLVRDACLRLMAAHWDVLRARRILLYEDVPYAQEEPGSVEQLVERLRMAGAVLERVPVDITSVFEDKVECVKTYASQWKISAMRPQLEQAARLASGEGGYAESFWWLRAPPALPLPPLVTIRGMPIRRFDETLTTLYRQRHMIHRLGIFIGHAVAMWRHHIEFLLHMFPNARVDVLALEDNEPEMSGFAIDRLRVTYFGRRRLGLLWVGMRWAGRIQTALIFGGSNWVGQANWVRRVMPVRQAYAFETLEDVCAVWRWWLTRDRADMERPVVE